MKRNPTHTVLYSLTMGELQYGTFRRRYSLVKVVVRIGDLAEIESLDHH